MLIRQAKKYEKIFEDLDLDIITKEHYPAYPANDDVEILEERVWLL